MSNATINKRIRVGARNTVGRADDARIAAARRVFGTWKRPLKQSIRTLARIRRGLDRRIG